MILDEKQLSGSDKEEKTGRESEFLGVNRLKALGIDEEVDSESPPQSVSRMQHLMGLAKSAMNILLRRNEDTFSADKARVAISVANSVFLERFNAYLQNGGKDEIIEYLERQIEERFPNKPTLAIDLFLVALRTDMCEALMRQLGPDIVRKSLQDDVLALDNRVVSTALVDLLPDVMQVRTERFLSNLETNTA